MTLRLNSSRQVCRMLLAAVVPLGVLTSCSSGPALPSSSIAATPGSGLHGIIHGGRQAVTNATVTVLATGVAGYGSTANILATTTTSAAGTFSFASGAYTCPTSGAPLYIVASGGNPGLSPTTQNPSGNNPDLLLAAALGACGSAEADASLDIDEVTTIATAYALAGFFNSATFGTSTNVGVADGIGTSSQNIAGLNAGFATFLTLVNPASGQSPGTTANATVESSKMNTLADILASCINSDPTSSTTCATLFKDVTPLGSIQATNTLEAAYYLATNPTSTNASGSSLATVFGLAQPGAPYQPTLSAAPGDWTLAIHYAIPTLAGAENIAVDAAGNVWLDGDGNGGSIPASVVEVSPAGQLLATIINDGSGNSLAAPRQIALDLNGNAWVASSGTNTLFEITGSSVAAVIPTGITPYALAIDPQNNVWLTEVNASSKVMAECAFNPSTNTFCTTLTTDDSLGTQTHGITIDPTAGNLWITNLGSSTYGNLGQYDGTVGTKTATYYTSQQKNAYFPVGIAFDASNNIWFANQGASSTASFLTEAANPPGTNPIGVYTGGGLSQPGYIAMDGASNLWAANLAASGSGSYSISEFNNSGVALSPASAGFAHAFTAPIAVGVDPTGNVWVANNSAQASYVSELVGAAVPVVTPLSIATLNGQVATEPGAGGPGAGTGGAGSAPGGLPIPASQAYLGAWSNPPNSGDEQVDIAALETSIGREFAVHLHYDAWSDTLPTGEVLDDYTNGHNRVPLISMHCDMPDAQTAAGDEDGNIIRVANELKAIGKPVMFRWQWEFNLVSQHQACLVDPSKSNDPLSVQESDFIAAWIHIWTVFQQQGATNVIFVWNPSGSDGVDPTGFYPGDAYVDWVGIDHYDRTTNNPSFNSIFSGAYAINSVHNKPIIIAETGAYTSPQAAYILQANSLLPTNYPLVKAFCYFNAAGQNPPGYTLGTNGIAAFATMGANSYFNLFEP